jgi:hypothetical protein
MMVLLQGGWRTQATTTHGRYQGKLMDVDPVILASARKHGIDDEDMLHAYRHRSEYSTSTTSSC